MATMNISVPDPMKDWVQSQVDTGAYSNTSDYVRDLIREDQNQLCIFLPQAEYWRKHCVTKDYKQENSCN
jgi:hypothetical protein